MQKKQIIQIAVIVIAFGLAGLVLYNGLYKNSSSAPLPSTAGVPGAPIASPGSSATAGQTIQSGKDILPYGDKLDFSVLHNPNGPKFQFDQYAYPKLNPQQDIGVNENTLISSAAGSGQ